MNSWMASHPWVLYALLGSIAALTLAFLFTILITTLKQIKSDRLDAERIKAFQYWEKVLPAYVFGEGHPPLDLQTLDENHQEWLRDFLRRFRKAVGGNDCRKLTEIYQTAGLHRQLKNRLASQSDRKRSTAAVEVWAFEQYRLLPETAELLSDPVPYVAHAAARTISKSGNMAYAKRVMDWVADQDLYQQERLISILEAFGPELIKWLEARLPEPPQEPILWRIYALLVATHRVQGSLNRLLQLTQHPDREVVMAAIKGLGALGNATAYPHVALFLKSQDNILRMQATRILDVLGGISALPELLLCLTDPSFEVRRHASQAMVRIGEGGVSALRWVQDDPTADPFARDMAAERLEWVELKGRL